MREVQEGNVTDAAMVDELDALILAERARIVRFCAAYTGEPEVAEDLAQETLLEAWRHKGELRDRTAYAPWLLGIARNLCMRWRRRRSKEPTIAMELYQQSGVAGARQMEVVDVVAEESDVELELEQRELADLLDRAMSYLPPLVRTVLVERYIMDSPLAEIAERTRLTEGAVAMRVHRGKLILKRILSTQLSQEAAAYGLAGPDVGERLETHMWCPICSRKRLLARLVPETREFAVWCPACYEESGQHNWGSQGSEGNDVVEGFKSYKVALSHFFNWYRETYLPALATGFATCSRCGQISPVRRGMPEAAGSGLSEQTGFHLECEGCGSRTWATYSGITRCLPDVQRFWREHPRMRTLPVREIEVAGSPAFVASFESVKSYARLDVVSASKDLRVLKIHEIHGD